MTIMEMNRRTQRVTFTSFTPYFIVAIRHSQMASAITPSRKNKENHLSFAICQLPSCQLRTCGSCELVDVVPLVTVRLGVGLGVGLDSLEAWSGGGVERCSLVEHRQGPRDRGSNFNRFTQPPVRCQGCQLTECCFHNCQCPRPPKN